MGATCAALVVDDDAGDGLDDEDNAVEEIAEDIGVVVEELGLWSEG